MSRFYVNPEQVGNELISITGPDVNHIRNVLRRKPGGELIICNGQGKDYYCIINKVTEQEIVAEIKEQKSTDSELKTRVTLFQGLPKYDKMELIIQKAVELGVYEIVPVITKRVIVRLDDRKKEEKKLERWGTIAESAAKQSQRGIIPVVKPVLSFKEALEYAAQMELGLIPYEKAKGMTYTREIMNKIPLCKSVGIMIGPEGGFEEAETEQALVYGMHAITLGRRILRTETAGITALSMMVLMLED